MEVTITRFRRELFDLVGQAMAGVEVWVTHKGQRFKVVPDMVPASKLSRIAPMEIVNSKTPESDEQALQTEMRLAWEKDWADL